MENTVLPPSIKRGDQDIVCRLHGETFDIIPKQSFVLVKMLEEGRLTDELAFLTNLLTGFSRFSNFDLKGT